MFPSNICQLSTATPRCSKTGLFSLSYSADSAVLARKTQVNTALPMRNKLFRADEETKLCYVAMYWHCLTNKNTEKPLSSEKQFSYSTTKVRAQEHSQRTLKCVSIGWQSSTALSIFPEEKHSLTVAPHAWLALTTSSLTLSTLHWVVVSHSLCVSTLPATHHSHEVTPPTVTLNTILKWERFIKRLQALALKKAYFW